MSKSLGANRLVVYLRCIVYSGTQCVEHTEHFFCDKICNDLSSKPLDYLYYLHWFLHFHSLIEHLYMHDPPISGPYRQKNYLDRYQVGLGSTSFMRADNLEGLSRD